mgnify:CR=1 FL=1
MKKYGVTEKEKPYLESIKCRQIVSEIMNFGVTQNQIEILIKLLALELEDREKMISIRNCLEAPENQIEKNSIVT